MQSDPTSTRVGWIGTGVMGASMAGHLLHAGYPLTVHTRTKARAEGLLAAGVGHNARDRGLPGRRARGVSR